MAAAVPSIVRFFHNLMKPTLYLFIAMLAGCASHTPPPITLKPIAPATVTGSKSALRTAEILKEYQFGRYIDPGDPLTMHESHPVYRIEASPRWNLYPGCGVGTNRNIGSSTVAANDAVVAEVNKQRASTRAFTEQTIVLNQHLAELSKTAAQNQELAKDNLSLKRDVAAIRDRVNLLDEQLNKSVAHKPTQTVDDKW
jgi:hypothetical protein